MCEETAGSIPTRMLRTDGGLDYVQTDWVYKHSVELYSVC